MPAALANLVLVEATPGREKDLERSLAEFVLWCRRAEGCLAYDFFQSLELSRRFMLQIRWRDFESLARHLASPELKEFLHRTPELQAAAFWEAYQNFLPEG